MIIIRLSLIVAVCLAAYTAVLVVYQVPYAWLIPVLVLARVVGRRTTHLWSHGTARWADSEDFTDKGMIDE